MTREEAIKEYIMPALKRTWNDDKCIEIISAIEQDPCAVTLIKIKSEIRNRLRSNEGDISYTDIIKIFYKYIGESEDKNDL